MSEKIPPSDEPDSFADDPADDLGADNVGDAGEESADQAGPTQSAAAVRRSRPVRRGSTKASSVAPPEPDDSDDDADVTPVRSRRPVKRVGSAATTGTRRAERRSAGTTVAKRDRSSDSVRTRRTTPAMFISQSVGELRKVQWPTGEQLGQYFVVVFFFVLFIIAYVGLLDLGFGWALLKLLGKK